MSEKTLPDLIADDLIARIFVGELVPGSRLPPERHYCETLGVDRTSLRIALRTLNRMNLVQSVRGSGITVMDYRRHAGLDFLAAIFDIPQLELGSRIKLEGLQAFNALIPGLLFETLKGPLDAALVMQVRDHLIEQVRIIEEGPLTPERLNKLSNIELALQDLLLYRGSAITELMANSTLSLRSRIMRELFEVIDIRAHVMFQQQLLLDIGSGRLPLDQVVGFFHRYSIEWTTPLIEKYQREDSQPRLLESPLKGFQHMARATL